MMSLRSRSVSLLKDISFQMNIARTMSISGSFLNVDVNESTGVATVVMKNAPVNTLSLEMLMEINQTLKSLEANKSRGMILASSVPHVFSAGLDLADFINPEEEKVRTLWSTLQEVWVGLYGSSFPTAAAITGNSPAAGCLLAMSCEYRVMLQSKYVIGLNEITIGMALPPFLQNTMRSVLSPKDAERAMAQGTLFSADEALKVGLIDEIATSNVDVLQKCENYIGKYAKIHPKAKSLTKKTFRQDVLKNLDETKEMEIQTLLSTFRSPTIQKNLAAYVESIKGKKK